jgi:NADH-quinone oxidoreductase subunit M
VGTSDILTSLLLIPFIGSIIIGLLPNKAARPLALIASGMLIVVSAYLWSNFSLDVHGMQFVQKINWINYPIPISYHVGIDGMSLCLVALTAFVTLMAVLASEKVGENRSKFYYSLVLLLTTSILGVFVSLDLVQFFVLYELELVPMYFLIAIWGGPRRDYAAMKFLLYTFLGGIFMLAGILYLYFQLNAAGVLPATFDMVELAKQAPNLTPAVQALACLGFMLAFIIKLPSFPFHTWLPDAHVEAPTPISMILAALLLKMGSYGLVRICMGFFPDVIVTYGAWIIALGCFNIVWAAIACLVQTDMKRIIAFSSVSHMGFILVGIGSLSALALNGAVFQMISHGIISAALFFLVGTVYDRVHTRNLVEIGGGLAKQMPYIFYFWMLAALANLGLPALSGFVAEALVFYGAFTSPMASVLQHPMFVRGCLAFAALGVILTAGYMLWLLKRLFYGPEQAKWAGHLTDMTLNEKVIASALSVLIIFLGIYPLWLSKKYTSLTDNMCQNIVSKNKIGMR